MNDERFEAWLDGDLDGDESLERELAADSTLAARGDLQARIDASLRARFAAPSSLELSRIGAAASASAWPWQRERRAWFALAATLLIALGIGKWDGRPRDEAPRGVARCMLDAYSASTGGSTSDACGSLEADWVRSKLQRSAVACTSFASGQAPLQHTLVIEGQAPTAGTPFTSCVRALVDGKRVLLWSAPVATDPKPSVTLACGFIAYRGELEGRVLYEYSPLHEAVLLREIGATLAP